jgi:hypothetical protein
VRSCRSASISELGSNQPSAHREGDSLYFLPLALLYCLPLGPLGPRGRCNGPLDNADVIPRLNENSPATTSTTSILARENRRNVHNAWPDHGHRNAAARHLESFSLNEANFPGTHGGHQRCGQGELS